jgi:hypothetical protein
MNDLYFDVVGQCTILKDNANTAFRVKNYRKAVDVRMNCTAFKP